MKDGEKSVHQVFLQTEDILDQAVFEKIWLPVGDNKEIDLDHLLDQDRININNF